MRTSTYQFWLCDDAGRRFYLFPKYMFFSYTRTVRGYGYIEFGVPFDEYQKAVSNIFQVDWRLEVWRSPNVGVPARRESSFLLRKYNVYTRQDGLRVIVFYGRSPLDILRRQFVDVSADVTITGTIDNVMKQLVTNYLVNASVGYGTVPLGEFTVESNTSEGPTITETYYLDNLLDALKDLQSMSETKNLESSANKKIYFDVVENDSLVINGFGYTFRTWSTLRGGDRTIGIPFSIENGNIKDPSYFEDHNDQFTFAHVRNKDNSAYNAESSVPDKTLSRWNVARIAESSSEQSLNANSAKSYKILGDHAAAKKLSVTFLNTPGSATQPRSLYGLEWDLGDLLPVLYAGKTFNAEVMVVYVSMNENGEETITGLNRLGE